MGGSPAVVSLPRTQRDSFGGVSTWGGISSWGRGEVEVAVGRESVVSWHQADEVLISLQERLEGSGLGSGEKETEGEDGGFHYF